LSSVFIKSLDEAEIRRAVDAYASTLFAGVPEVEEVVVFGSFATGRWAPGSDVDVLVVLSQATQPVHERVAALLPGKFPVGIDVFPYTRAELHARRDSPLVRATEASTWRYRRTDAA
jgi:predicted nucleotidyltransferase